MKTVSDPNEVPKCRMFHQTNAHLYISQKAYDEIEQALRDAGHHFGADGFVGGNHVRFNGVFVVMSPAAARKENIPTGRANGRGKSSPNRRRDRG